MRLFGRWESTLSFKLVGTKGHFPDTIEMEEMEKAKKIIQIAVSYMKMEKVWNDSQKVPAKYTRFIASYAPVEEFQHMEPSVDVFCRRMAECNLEARVSHQFDYPETAQMLGETSLRIALRLDDVQKTQIRFLNLGFTTMLSLPVMECKQRLDDASTNLAALKSTDEKCFFRGDLLVEISVAWMLVTGELPTDKECEDVESVLDKAKHRPEECKILGCFTSSMNGRGMIQNFRNALDARSETQKSNESLAAVLENADSIISRLREKEVASYRDCEDLLQRSLTVMKTFEDRESIEETMDPTRPDPT